MRLRVHHTTIYRYPAPVRENTNEVRLLPRVFPRQHVLREDLRVSPPAPMFYSTDFWGNRVVHFTALAPHSELRIDSDVVVQTLPPPDLTALRLPTAANYEVDGLHDFLRPTRLTAPPPDLGPIGHAVANLRQAARDLPDYLDLLCIYLRQTLRFEPGLTSVDSTVADVIQAGGGVCQDFSHLFIAICRSQGIPTRYAGGYHYLGPHAERHENHAWAEAYLPGAGWCGWDPTNATRVGEAHVQVTAGRDYVDVSPVRGSYRGAAGSDLEVLLTMEAVEFPERALE